jgi:hypothetical protein
MIATTGTEIIIQIIQNKLAQITIATNTEKGDKDSVFHIT